MPVKVFLNRGQTDSDLIAIRVAGKARSYCRGTRLRMRAILTHFVRRHAQTLRVFFLGLKAGLSFSDGGRWRGAREAEEVSLYSTSQVIAVQNGSPRFSWGHDIHLVMPLIRK